MKKGFFAKGFLPLAVALLLGSCTLATSKSTATTTSTASVTSESAGGGSAQTSSNTTASYTTASSTATSTSYTAEDGKVAIALADGASTCSSSNVTIDNSKNQIVIKSVGTYVLSGTLSDGSIIVNAEETTAEDTVELVLNGVNITSKGSSTYVVASGTTSTTMYPGPIYSVASSKLDVKALKDSSNVILDSRKSTLELGDDKAAIFSNKKLQIKGAGSLNVTSTYNSGIASDSKVEAAKATLAITSYSHAIKAHNSIILGGADDLGSFTLTTKGSDETCIRVDEDNEVATPVYGNNASDDDIAGIEIKDGAYVINGTGNTLSSEAYIYLEGGNGSIVSSAGKGIKAQLNIFIDGGDFTVKSLTDDCIHATTGSITINNGTYTLTTGTTAGLQGVNATNALNINGGTITVTASYEGFQALTINATGGTTYVQASDDGWNAAGGNDSSGSTGWGGGTATSGSTPLLNITGGNHYVAAAGDGIDSNGNITISGGFTVVSQTGSGNGPIDYGDGGSYSFKQTGGFLAAYGGSDMLVTSSGSQYSLLTSWSSAVSTSNYIVITNSGISYAVEPQYQSAYSIYISSPSFAAGSVTVTKATSISNGTELFKGVYTGYSASTSSLATGGTWSSSNVNINNASSSGGGRTGPGGR